MNCLLNEELNSRNMCTFFHSKNPGQLLADMQRSTFVSSKYEKSFTFYSLKKKLLPPGLDKGGNNLAQTMRDYNRERGNSGVHVQCPGCLERPVAECPENVAISFCSPQFTLLDTFNEFVSDFLFSLIFVGEKSNGDRVDRVALVSMFKSVPTPPQLTDSKFNGMCTMNKTIAVLIYLGMNTCRWAADSAKFKDKLSAIKSGYEKELKEAEDDADVLVKPQPKNVRSNSTRKHTSIRGLENKTTKNARDLTSIKILHKERAVLEEELADIRAHRIITARDGSISTLHVILGGLK